MFWRKKPQPKTVEHWYIRGRYVGSDVEKYHASTDDFDYSERGDDRRESDRQRCHRPCREV